MDPTATDAGATRDCGPRVPARRGEMPGPARMTAEMPAPAGMTAEMLAAAGMAAEMRGPSPAAMATTVASPVASPVATPMTAAFWACQRETRQRNRENGDRNDAEQSHGGPSMHVPFRKRGAPGPGSPARTRVVAQDADPVRYNPVG